MSEETDVTGTAPAHSPLHVVEPSSAVPQISVVIGVYDDWIPLDGCLKSLAGQLNAPQFEVIVIDDGSRQPVPEQICRWGEHFTLVSLRQAHAGISTARNRGIEVSRGPVLLFVDADCRLQSDCLAALDLAVTNLQQSNCFQLRVTGDLEGIVGRAEDLRLRTLQENLVQEDGRIRYLNTAGFAIRRSRIRGENSLFKSAFSRGEDTVLLAELMLDHELPSFIPSAIVQHSIQLSLLRCFWKDIRLAGLSRNADVFIAAMGLKVRMNASERLAAAIRMWKTSSNQSIGRAAWFVVVARQGVQRLSSLVRIFSRPKQQ